jgi:hypothetical protein
MRRTNSLLGLVALAALLGSACTGNARLWHRLAEARMRHELGRQAIAVQVLDWEGRPLRDVAVVASRVEDDRVLDTSDADGWARLEVATGGQYEVTVYYGTTKAALPVRLASGDLVTARLSVAMPLDLPRTPLIELVEASATPERVAGNDLRSLPGR